MAEIIICSLGLFITILMAFVASSNPSIRNFLDYKEENIKKGNSNYNSTISDGIKECGNNKSCCRCNCRNKHCHFD